MNKTSKWMLTALLTVGLSMGFVACSDDEENNGGLPTNEAEYQESQLGWDIITQLTSERTAPEGWQNMTFEPTIGKASEADPYTRIVSTNDVAAAAERFGGLVGFPDLISETTTSFTYNQEGMGKLTYKKGSEGEGYLAQVDVDLKQLPHLKRILYQTPDQMGNNGSFDGTAYYRFGDVVMDKGGYYWICVRPAFGPEGKEDSHWMCLSHNLPDANIKPYKTSTGNQNYLPTGLGKSTEHMQNAAEMFYAILNPNDWQNSLISQKKPKMFNDFSTSKMEFHNPYFWQLVSRAWEKENLFSTVLGVSKEDLSKNLEWHMLYSGYSWYFTTSWNCNLFEATYKNGKEKKANMHDVTYSKPTKDMHQIVLDAKDGSKVGTVNGPFFDNDGKLRWYARYKKGSELGGGRYNVKLKIDDCTDIYVYNTYYNRNLHSDPEITKETDVNPQVKSLSEVTKEDRGKMIGQDGNIYVSKQAAKNAGTQAVAMVVDTYNTDWQYQIPVANNITNQYSEYTYGHIHKGIAIALEDGKADLGNAEDSFEKIVAKTEKSIIEVRSYDPDWYNSHKLTGGGIATSWLLPNDYHWQRLLLPYGATTILHHESLKTNLEGMTSSYQDDIAKSEGFISALEAVGAGLAPRNEYIVANGIADYWDGNPEGEENEKGWRPFSIQVSDRLSWCISTYGSKVRYVLVW